MSHGLYQSAASDKSSDNDPFFHVVQRLAIIEASDNLSHSMGSNLVNQSSDNSSAHNTNDTFHTTAIETINESINHQGNLSQNQIQLNLDNSLSYSGNECGLLNNNNNNNNNNKYQLFVNRNHQPVTSSHQFPTSRCREHIGQKSYSETNLNLFGAMGTYHSKHFDSCFKQKQLSSELKNPTSGDESLEMEIESLRSQLKSALDIVNERNVRIEELQREINKLTSVLDQTQIHLESTDLMGSENSIPNRSKKQGVSGESNKDQTNLKLVKYQKSNRLVETIVGC